LFGEPLGPISGVNDPSKFWVMAKPVAFICIVTVSAAATPGVIEIEGFSPTAKISELVESHSIVATSVDVE